MCGGRDSHLSKAVDVAMVDCWSTIGSGETSLSGFEPRKLGFCLGDGCVKNFETFNFSEAVWNSKRKGKLFPEPGYLAFELRTPTHKILLFSTKIPERHYNMFS
jgi:hypothetical protein